MSNSPSQPDPNAVPVVPAYFPKLNLVAVLAALGSPVRWPIMQLLADGRTMNISDAAAVARTSPENISKQLRVLVNAGVVTSRPGADRRQTLFSIPAAYRPAPGVLDFGVCVVHLNQV